MIMEIDNANQEQAADASFCLNFLTREKGDLIFMIVRQEIKHEVCQLGQLG